MYQDVTTIKPLFLSEEEAMAILDLCLTSAAEMDAIQERALRKVTDLARAYLRDTMRNGEHLSATCPQVVAGDDASAGGMEAKTNTAGLFSQPCLAFRTAPLMTMTSQKAHRTRGSLWNIGAAITKRRHHWPEIA